jgi:hypothetical protein
LIEGNRRAAHTALRRNLAAHVSSAVIFDPDEPGGDSYYVGQALKAEHKIRAIIA